LKCITHLPIMDKIFYKKKLVGIKISKMLSGTSPVTEGKEPFQALTLKHPKGKYLLAHTHRPRKRITTRLQECLVVRKGKVKIDLYGPDDKKFKHIYLKAGEAFLLVNGGYGIHVVQDAEMMEFKNGPFIEDKVLI